jgi:hypothetical protein
MWKLMIVTVAMIHPGGSLPPHEGDGLDNIEISIHMEQVFLDEYQCQRAKQGYIHEHQGQYAACVREDIPAITNRIFP